MARPAQCCVAPQPNDLKSLLCEHAGSR